MRRERSFPTKREAREWLAAQDTDAKRGVWADPLAGRETVEVIAALWKEATRHHIGPKTREGYASILRAHIEPEFGPRRVSGIDAADIQRFANKLADRRSAKTARNVIVVLSAILDFAVVRKYIVVNPCSSIRVPTGRRQRKNSVGCALRAGVGSPRGPTRPISLVQAHKIHLGRSADDQDGRSRFCPCVARRCWWIGHRSQPHH